MKSAGISADSLRTRDSAGCSRICIESKSSTPSRAITISPSRAEWGGKQVAEGTQLGEVAEQRPAVTRPERELVAVVLQHAPEAVPFRLELPAVRVWKLLHELRFHGRKGHVWSGHRAEPYWQFDRSGGH